MPTTAQMPGIHHITAVSSSAVENLAYYRNTLGLRLVKKTVNFDDPYTYHLYYGDGQGAPGTILTFFPWENLPLGTPGAGMVTAVAFAVPQASMDFWRARLTEKGVSITVGSRFGEPLIQFKDPHGLPLELLGVASPPQTTPWEDGPLRPEVAIRGFHSATATFHILEPEQHLLTEVMGLSRVAQEGRRIRYKMADEAAAGRYFDLVVDPNAPPGRPGSGTIHHIAFRAADDTVQAQWRTGLSAAGIRPTAVRDRNYFRSIYFNSPGGVLFEIATDPPGFDVDESVEALGSALKLPTQLEPLREDIERRLPPLSTTPHPHLYQALPLDQDNGDTVVTFHGTGGSEYDLVELATQLFGPSTILSPRGMVNENGLQRFFRRLANNVFDERDVIARAHELTDFLIQAAHRYGRDPGRLTACGYSNGANIAAAMLLLRPEVFEKAVLLRPMLPLKTVEHSDLSGKRILILRGARDRVIPPDSTDQLIDLLRGCGADVSIHTAAAGHEIVAEDIEAARKWVAAGEDGPGQPLAESMMPETA
jgi:predicted esterase/catechol 2,3-dioxygenase-like lactoylglutathione lyase family enzyme